MLMKFPMGNGPRARQRPHRVPRIDQQPLALLNAKIALAKPNRHAREPFWRAELYVVGDHGGSATSFMWDLWLNHWVDEQGWLSREVGLIVAGNLWDGDPRSQAGSLRADELMAWLAAHDREQIQLVMGAHDLERLGPLGSLRPRILRRAREAAVAALRLKTSDERRRFLSEWARLHKDEPAPYAAYEFRGHLPAEARLLRRLLLSGRMQLATAVRDVHDCRPILITHSGITRNTVDRLGVGSDAFAIAKKLNDRLRESVDRVRSDWESGGSAPLDLGWLYHPWSATCQNSGPLAYRPNFSVAVSQVSSVLGLDTPIDDRAIAFEQLNVPDLTQIAGHTVPDRVVCPYIDVQPSTSLQSFVSNGMTVLASTIGGRGALYDRRSGFCEWPEDTTVFVNWTSPPKLGRALVPPPLVSHVLHGNWARSVPAPSKEVPKALGGLITILSVHYSSDELQVIEKFMTECVGRLSGPQSLSGPDADKPAIEDMYDWVKILQGTPGTSIASKLGQRWRNAYLNSCEGKPPHFPPAAAWRLGDQ